MILLTEKQTRKAAANRSLAPKKSGYARVFSPYHRGKINAATKQLESALNTLLRKVGYQISRDLRSGMKVKASLKRQQLPDKMLKTYMQALQPMWILGFQHGEKAAKKDFEAQFAEPTTELVILASEALHDAIWSRVVAIDDALRLALETTIAEGYRNGETMDELAARITSTSDRFTRSRASMIARTETLKSFNMGHMKSVEDNDLLPLVEWIDGQAGACEFCHALDGKKVLKGESFPGTIGITAPPLHPRCRCALGASIPTKEEIEEFGLIFPYEGGADDET